MYNGLVASHGNTAECSNPNAPKFGRSGVRTFNGNPSVIKFIIIILYPSATLHWLSTAVAVGTKSLWSQDNKFFPCI